MLSAAPIKLTFVLFITLLGVLLLGACLYLSLRIRKKWAWALFGFIFILQIITPSLYRHISTYEQLTSLKPFFWISYFSLSFLIMAITSFAALELPRRKALKAHQHDHTRREFLKTKLSYLGLGSAGVLSGLGFAQAKSMPKLYEVEVPIKGLHPDLDGFKIAQLTDIHIGPTIDARFLTQVVAHTNSLQADLIALTGDLMDGYVPFLKDQLSPLQNLKSTLGTYFVPGNHEFYWGIEEWLPIMKEFGAKPLLNESVLIEKGAGCFQLSGVWDFNAHRFGEKYRSSPIAAMKNFSSNDKPISAKILLAHQPKSCFEASRAGFDLQISGHTHAGQFMPWNFLVNLAQPYSKGLNQHQQMWVYVSRGTGYWGAPLRLGIPSELTLIKLKATS